MRERKHILMALNWYHPKLHQGIAHFSGENSWHLHSYMAMHRGGLPYGWKGDGVLCSVSGDAVYNRFIDSLDCPKVYLGRGQRDGIYGVISEDDVLIGKMAADYYLSKSFRNFAWFSPTERFHKERRDSYASTLQEFGFSTQFLSPPAKISNWSTRHSWLVAKLKEQTFPLAIFAAEDNVASSVIAAVMDAGLRIPEQVAVLGVRNDVLICESLPVSLSSIEYDMSRMGYLASQFLETILSGEPYPSNTMLIPPICVISRQSTDIIAVEHQPTSDALNFIRNNFKYPIMVSDVAVAASLSVRGLVKAFKQHTGRTITDEINRLRVDEACRQLGQGDLKVELVAINAGFGDKGTFFRTFKKTVGLTPNAYRKQLKNR